MNKAIAWIGIVLVWLLASTAAQAGTRHYYYTDPQGTVLATTDEAGNIVETADYRPYGARALGAAKDGPGYTGHVSDAGSGFVYMQQRYYDPVIGRFLSVDPVTVYEKPGQNFNRYGYVNDNPYAFTDPDGREAACITLGTSCGFGSVSQAEFNARVSTVADFTPVVGDIKGIVEAVRNPSAANIAAAVVGLVPGVGDAAGKAIKAGGNIVENAAKGAKAESAVAAALGEAVAGRHVTLQATTGQRSVADIVKKDGGVVEVKSGSARLSSGQRAVKADIDAGRAITPRGQNALDAGLKPGVPTPMKCYDVTRC